MSVAWLVALPSRQLQEQPREQRMPILSQSINLHDPVCCTSATLKHDLVSLFSGSSWASKTVVEVGSADGGTTNILAMLFGAVFTVELHLPNIKISQRGWTAGLSNVMHLNLDSGAPYAFSFLAGNKIDVAFIDGAHDQQHVFGDTFGLLHEVPCCLGLLIYHDYCDAEVFAVTEAFVAAGVLRPHGSVGRERWIAFGVAMVDQKPLPLTLHFKVWSYAADSRRCVGDDVASRLFPLQRQGLTAAVGH